METDFSYIDENLKKIIFNVNEAAAKYRHPDEKIKIMAVTKTVDPEAVNHAIGLGIDLLGENRVQEYMSKKDFYKKSADVHFIGHLQTNKVKYIIDSVSVIQSVDSAKLAAEIDKNARRIGKVQDVLVEINIGNEDSKGGIDKSCLKELLCEMSEMNNIKVRGLMAIPPIESPEKFLCSMQQIYIDISEENIDNISMDILSMGMSNDYAKAIQYGSNLIRIGRGLFGPRTYK
ncbi:YggS family pyridoxal phosphate-dependent enzyme [Porcipelethomonas sp.]|uniref:YggS family pyridoxal phosphate-dependent enzyme n=1 Tax=Porcipelethomonas sp. TaxID=2981675 RepID=UPI003EF41574